MENLPAARFWSLVERLQYYDGAVRWHALHPPEQEQSDEDLLLAHTAGRRPAMNFAPGSYHVVKGDPDG